MMTKIAFIIGNGPSRSPIELNQLTPAGKTFGCNALYRDFPALDYLVAIDDGMAEEIRRADDCSSEVIIPPYDEQFEIAEYNPLMRRRSNAGMNAMIEAIRLDHNILYCLGFDFILEGPSSVDNIYKNTENYGPETHAHESDNYYRVKYFEWFANHYHNTKFVMVIPDGMATKRVDADNVSGMAMSVFIKNLRD
jgi:hypothetical protein